MSQHERECRDCSTPSESSLNRRDFVRLAGTTGAAVAGLGTIGSFATPKARAADAVKQAPETLVKVLYDSLKPEQKKEICFDWDHTEKARGLLRTRVSNNWHITKPVINSDYFSKDQKHLVRQIWEGLVNPEWHSRVDKQLKDDAGGFGNSQNIAIFGKPGDGKFELVMTGRHMTIRCDGNSAENLAFGGPIFYGHAAQGFNEKPDHPGNVYWPQALAANEVFKALDGKQQKVALVKGSPDETEVAFRGEKGKFLGIAVKDMSSDQKGLVQKTLGTLLEMYRQSEGDEVNACLKKFGGLDNCHMAFYQDEDLGDDKVWDVWRLEGPAFVWHFRGAPHVHVWVHVADSADVKLNA